MALLQDEEAQEQLKVCRHGSCIQSVNFAGQQKHCAGPCRCQWILDGLTWLLPQERDPPGIQTNRAGVRQYL